MCFELDSSPPIPPIAGAAVSHDDLVLEASDRNQLAAFIATPEEPSEIGIVVLPDVRGLYRFYEELALRFAERGYTAIAFDYFGRTAGVEKRDADFEYMPHVLKTTRQGVQADVGASVEELRKRRCSTIFTVGFCFGGRNSWFSALGAHGLAGAIGFYGQPTNDRFGNPGPAAEADQIECPILALQAGVDENIKPEHNAEFDRALTEAGIPHEVVTYDGAPHSFFDRKHEEFADASENAWTRVLAFIEQYSRAGAAA